MNPLLGLNAAPHLEADTAVIVAHAGIAMSPMYPINSIKGIDMTIDRTHTGFEGRIDLGKLRICFSMNRPRFVLLPLIAIWRI